MQESLTVGEIMIETLRMKVYSGYLVGGPDDGRFVETAITAIPAQSTTELWLDGKDDPDTVTNLVVIKGVYLWNERRKYFKWHQESIEFYRKKPELL